MVNQQRSVENEIEMNEREKQKAMVKDTTQTNKIERVIVSDSGDRKQANKTDWYFNA